MLPTFAHCLPCGWASRRPYEEIELKEFNFRCTACSFLYTRYFNIYCIIERRRWLKRSCRRLERRRYPRYLSSLLVRVRVPALHTLTRRRRPVHACFCLRQAFRRAGSECVNPRIEALRFGPYPVHTHASAGVAWRTPCFFLLVAKPFYINSLGFCCQPAGTSSAYRPAHIFLPLAPRLPLFGIRLCGWCGRMQPAQYHDTILCSSDCEAFHPTILCLYPLLSFHGSRF